MKYVKCNTYSYKGPAFRFGRFIGNFDIVTEAVSLQKAKSNISYRIKKSLDLDKSAKIELDDSKLALVENKVVEDKFDNDVHEPEQLRFLLDEL